MLIYLPPQAMVFCTLGLLNSDLVIQQILVECLLCVRLVGHGVDGDGPLSYRTHSEERRRTNKQLQEMCSVRTARMGTVQVLCEHIVVCIFQRLEANCKAIIISPLYMIEQ